VVVHDHAPLSDIAQGIWDLVGRHPAVGNVHLAFGTIQADGSLLVDGFAQYAYRAYWEPALFTLLDPMTITSLVAVGDHGSHQHDVVRPAPLEPPLDGQVTRVLVAFVNADTPGGQGVDPVVLFRLVRREL
jgi:hypothetical protein